MKALFIVLALALVGLVALAIIKLRRQKKEKADCARKAAWLQLAKPHFFRTVMDKTWKYFDTHPETDDVSWIHLNSIYIDRACLVGERLVEGRERKVTVNFLINYYFKYIEGVDPLSKIPLNAKGQYEAVFDGPDARSRAEEIIKHVLMIDDTSYVTYHLAGADAPVYPDPCYHRWRR